jgi:hypothetical protein
MAVRSNYGYDKPTAAIASCSAGQTNKSKMSCILAIELCGCELTAVRLVLLLQ